MGNQFDIIRQGESLPFTFDRDGLSINGWVCTINVLQAPGDTPAITRVIPPTSTGWTGFLTSTETAALATGAWRLVGNLTNSGTDEEEVQIIRFNVTDLWAA